jgi:hypothetical protein
MQNGAEEYQGTRDAVDDVKERIAIAPQVRGNRRGHDAHQGVDINPVTLRQRTKQVQSFTTVVLLSSQKKLGSRVGAIEACQHSLGMTNCETNFRFAGPPSGSSATPHVEPHQS